MALGALENFAMNPGNSCKFRTPSNASVPRNSLFFKYISSSSIALRSGFCARITVAKCSLIASAPCMGSFRNFSSSYAACSLRFCASFPCFSFFCLLDNSSSLLRFSPISPLLPSHPIKTPVLSRTRTTTTTTRTRTTTRTTPASVHTGPMDWAATGLGKRGAGCCTGGKEAVHTAALY